MIDSPNTLRELLEYSSFRFGNKACIKYIENGQLCVKTYSDMYRDSMLAAAHLINTVGGRTHIAIIGKTSYDFLTFYNAVFISGCVVVPIAPELPSEDIAELLIKADVTAVIYDESTKDKIETLHGAGSLILIPIQSLTGELDESALPCVDPDECAMIMFTSGTTGDKKGVMLSSKALISNVMFREMSYEGDHVALNVLPMHHIFSFSCDYLKNLKDGVTICLNGEQGNIFENLLRFEPTVIRLVPMMIETLLKKTKMIKRRFPDLSDREAAEKVFGKRLHSIIASGARLNPEIAAEYEKADILIRQGYGMTETGPRIAVPNGKTGFEAAGAVIDICEVRIQDGEIQLKSPSVMMGYYKDPEATKAAFTEDGWFMTGDIGYMREDRQLFITGRKKNLIILSNGENISPEEIEKKLIDFPGVEEVLVYGADDKLTAEFYLSPELIRTKGEAPVMNEIDSRLESYNLSVPNEKEIVKTIFRNTPFEKTESGKIKRTQVQF